MLVKINFKKDDVKVRMIDVQVAITREVLGEAHTEGYHPLMQELLTLILIGATLEHLQQCPGASHDINEAAFWLIEHGYTCSVFHALEPAPSLN